MKRTDLHLLLHRIFERKYFTFDELKCKCGCNTLEVDETFLYKILKFRVIYGIPFSPVSFYRCVLHKDYSFNHDKHACDVPYNYKDSNQRCKIISSALTAGITRIGIHSKYIHLDDNPIHNGTPLQFSIWPYPINWEKLKTKK